VFQNYFRPRDPHRSERPLVARQAGLPLAQTWGGGLVAAVDGMRLSPFVNTHLGVHGTYSFTLPDFAPGAIRDLRDPDATDDDDE
jgi:hypothetical protein